MHRSDRVLGKSFLEFTLDDKEIATIYYTYSWEMRSIVRLLSYLKISFGSIIHC